MISTERLAGFIDHFASAAMTCCRGVLPALLLAASLQMSLVAKAADEMPIIAYMGVPDWRTTDADFLTFSECGFNVSLYPYQSLDLLVKACRIADQHGVKVIGQCPEMTKSPVAAANVLKRENGFFGYFIKDEPSAPEIQQLQKEISSLRRADSMHVFYLNLFPYYNPDWVEPSMKVKTYPEYLREALKTSCQQLSFDFYPITTAGVRPTWYHNLEMARRESMVAGKPFWAFVLSVPHDVPFAKDTYYPTPTLASLRLQVYSNLAYGAQAIQYFTYWTLSSSRYKYHDAPVDSDGKKTPTYAVVQQMNRELKQVAQLFFGAKVVAVHHLGTIPEGTARLEKIPENLLSLKINSRKGALISQIEKDGHLYLAIVNKDHERSIKVEVRAKNTTPRYLTKGLTEQLLKKRYIVEAGDLLLFRLN